MAVNAPNQKFAARCGELCQLVKNNDVGSVRRMLDQDQELREYLAERGTERVWNNWTKSPLWAAFRFNSLPMIKILAGDFQLNTDERINN